MRILILSQSISWTQSFGEMKYEPPYDVAIEYGELNGTDAFNWSVFDFDVCVAHIEEPEFNSIGYFENMSKFIRDGNLALQNGRTVIILPHSRNFRPERLNDHGEFIYHSLSELGVSFRDNQGGRFIPVGKGKAKAVKEYLQKCFNYYQVVASPNISTEERLAVIADTEIVVGIEKTVEKGTLVVLPPPSLAKPDYFLSMFCLVQVARRYFEKNQKSIQLSDAPDWLEEYRIERSKEIRGQLTDLRAEYEKLERIVYVLYGTGEELESSVELLLKDLGFNVVKQPPAANIDFKADHLATGLKFAIEVTGIKGIIKKDSSKVGQAWQYIREKESDEQERLVVIANTELYIDPKNRNQNSFSRDAINLLQPQGVLLMNTIQLYDLWKSTHQGNAIIDEGIRALHSQAGILRV